MTYLIADDQTRCCSTWTRVRGGRIEEQHEATCPRFPARNAWDRCAGTRVSNATSEVDRA